MARSYQEGQGYNPLDTIPPESTEVPPYNTIPEPPHVSTSVWQESYYDPTSTAPAAAWVKIPSGPARLDNGRRTGEDFPSGAMWKQV